MIWGGIGFNYKSPLVIFKKEKGKGIDHQMYLKQVLEPVVGSCFNTIFKVSEGAEYVEDGIKLLCEAKRMLNIPIHNRPASSPDFNPIGDIWKILKQRIKARLVFPNTLEKMEAVLFEEWKNNI